MPIRDEERNEFLYLQKLADVMENLEIPITELFWDENVIGYKPDKYAVYYITNERSALSSSDDSEEDCVDLTVSFYIKGNFRSIKSAALKAFQGAGFYISAGYETYEPNTRYNHFDVELKYYF